MSSDKKQKEISQEEQIQFLRKVNFFQGFDDQELKQFLQVSKWRRFPPGTEIIREEATERAFYILVKGLVRVEKRQSESGQIIVLTTLAAGDCFGEMALVTETKRTAGVVADTEVFILRVEPEIVSTSNVFLQLKFYKRFCERLVSRLDTANKKIAERDGKEPAPSLGVSPDKVKKPGRADGRQDRSMGQAGADDIPLMPNKDLRHTPAKLRKLLHSETALPVNPAVAAQISALLNNGAGSDNIPRRLVDLISLDPVLSCRVIHTANSPFYRRANMVETVPLAMVIVGIKQIQEMLADTINAAEAIQAFSGFTAVSGAFWQHAVVVGRIAEMLREVTRITTSADLYLCGLLHDLGMLALDVISPNFYPQFVRPSGDLRDMAREEKEYIGADHGQAGAWLAEGLGLPQPYIDVMRFHHQPEKAANNLVPVAMINLANIFAALKGACLGQPQITRQDVVRSFSWAMLQEHHLPFQEVNIPQFVNSFSEELDKAWPALTGDIPV